MYKEQTATGRYTINPTHYVIIMENSEILNSCIIYDRDFDFSYENFQILVEKYLFRNLEGRVIERPQQMFMRTAIGIHGNDINSIIRTYNLMSEKCVMFSPSILRSACIEGASAVSSYTLAMRSDNIEGIFNSIEDLQVVVDEGVSVGFNMQCIRAKRSLIRGEFLNIFFIHNKRFLLVICLKKLGLCYNLYFYWHNNYFRTFLSLKFKMVVFYY